MSSQPSSQSSSIGYTTGTLHLPARPAPARNGGDKIARLMFEDPSGGHYDEMHHGQNAWDPAASHDDEERPRE